MNGKPQDRYPYQASPEAASQQPPTRAAHRQGLPSPFRHLQHLLLPLLLGWGAMATAQALGTTPGELSVNSGAASYTIPIAVPPGVAGMEPALSLVVDTSGRNGLAGLGGSIDGLSVISRCPASIDVDGHAGSIALDRSDHFCLDGQRLILATGTQSRHGSLYQPEVTNLSRVEAKGNAGEGPAWFEVRTKAGLRMQYGSTTNARVKGAQQSEIIAWAVNRIQDTLGNAIEFTYHANHYAGEHYPVRVSYGGNSVEFLYEEHPIHLIGYGLGLSQIRTQRLSSVQVRAGGQIVRSYQLSYAPADDLSPSRLTEVSLCDAANAQNAAASANRQRAVAQTKLAESEILRDRAHEQLVLMNRELAMAKTALAYAERYGKEVEELERMADSYQAILGDEDYAVFWRAQERDAAGRLTSALHGNGLRTAWHYDQTTGTLDRIETGLQWDALRELAYEYDDHSNVVSRRDLVNDLSEDFQYDRLDRLIQSRVSSDQAHSAAYNATIAYQYDLAGNMTYKSDVGSYTYSGTQPSRLARAGTQHTDYAYDANGNVTRGGGRTFVWASHNKPTRMTKGDARVSFAYDPERARYKRVDNLDGRTTTTLYLGKTFEQITTGDKTTYKYFIYAGDQLAAIHFDEVDSAGDQSSYQTRYLHGDALGSVDLITDGTGQVVNRMSFDPFGKRRPADWRTAMEENSETTLAPLLTNRGFTGHEHVAAIGIIYMNGRIYDPEMGRFRGAESLNHSSSLASPSAFHYTACHSLMRLITMPALNASILNPATRRARLRGMWLTLSLSLGLWGCQSLSDLLPEDQALIEVTDAASGESSAQGSDAPPVAPSYDAEGVSEPEAEFPVVSQGSLMSQESLMGQGSLMNEDAIDDLWPTLRAGFALQAFHDMPGVDAEIRWLKRNPDYLMRLAPRMQRYLPYILDQVLARELPAELALLPIVESGLNPRAFSGYGASGPWQFMRPTAQEYGLLINNDYDGRRDYVAATDGALSFLTYLHGRFNSWPLALAAYNAGSRRVANAVRQAGTENFSALKLPRETRAYVPRLMALAALVAHPARFKLSLPSISPEPQFFALTLPGAFELDVLAETIDLPLAALYDWNPALKSGRLASPSPLRVLLPIQREDGTSLDAQDILAQVTAVPADQRLRWQTIRVRSGDTLSGIALRHKTSLRLIKASNNLASDTIRVGQALRLPAPGAKLAQAGTGVPYVVQPGDSLWLIARRWQVPMGQLIKVNEVGPREILAVGRQLVIPVATNHPVGALPQSRSDIRKITYRVRRGDSLSRIAQRFGIGIGDIERWNSLDRRRYLQPGQRLTLYVDALGS